MKNKFIGSSFDDFLAEEGITEEVEAGALKKAATVLGKKLRFELV